MIRVACVGITVMDRIYYVEGLPTESGKYVARNYTEVGGGFIGLGQMGSPMASNLLQQGHQLRVFDVNAEAVRHLVDKGATPAANPAQAAKDAEFIITMLPNGDLVAGQRRRQRLRRQGWGRRSILLVA